MTEQKDKVVIFDTTLRDGEQCPGASMNLDEKLQVARQLAKLKVDIMEAGFPICSPGDWEAVNEIAKEIEGPVITGLARASEKDIDAAGTAVEPASKKRIHTFIATSPIHMEKKLKKTPDEVLKMAVRAVEHARTYTDDIEWSAEDAGRSDLGFLIEIVTAVIEAGATTVNIPDTVGFQVPAQIGMIFKTLKDRVPNIEKAILSAHCHNDLGLAVANSLAAVENGARQIECTINGIGERAGNCSLEEVVMALRVRGDAYGVGTTIKTQEIYRTSRLVTSMTGLLVQRNKAIIGANAFAHEAGIHQDGMLKDANTYEIMRPEDVGVPSSELVLGKHSGRHAFSTRLEEIGFSLSAEQIDKAFERFKRVADKKKEMFDEDLEAIVEDEVFKIGECFKLDYLEVSAGTIKNPTAKIRIEVEGEIKEESSSGDGPVDATYQAINKVTGIKTELSDYRIKAITRGRDALGEVSVSIKADDYKFTGRGASTDIIEASAKAYINALNRFVAQKKRAETRAQTDSAGI